MAAPSEDSDDSRVVLHLDLDCFYCQVESQRLRLDPAAPLAVRQWQGLIAVNYAAREAGVTRHMTAAEALKICPSIALAHVETLGEGGASDGGSVVFGGGRSREGGASSSSSSAAAAAAAAAVASQQQQQQQQQQQFVPRKSDRKACLLRYRDASARVLQALRSFFPPGTVIEKASIDEFYVDATSAAESMLRPENGGCASGVCEAAARAPGGAVVVAEEEDEAKEEKERGGSGGKASGSPAPSSSFPLDPTNPFDAHLAAGAALASGARAQILRETGYTVSAGISHNKLLSKIASARFKPNRQAVVPRRGAPRLLRALPLSKLPGFGGKLGAAVSAATGAETAGDVAALPFEAIKAALGGDNDAALAVSRAVRGDSRSAVVEKAAPKSLMAAKSLDVATSSRPLLERWLSILADELATRLGADGRPPRTLALHYRCRGMGAERSVSGPAPRAMRRPAAAAAAEGGGGQGGSRGGSAPPPPSSSSVAVAVPPDAGAIAAAAGVLLTRAMGVAAAAAAAKGASAAAGRDGGGGVAAPWPPCSRLSLVAGDFAPPRATGAASIASFFSASPVKRKKEEERAEVAEEEEVAQDEEEVAKEELMPPPPPVSAPATAAASNFSSLHAAKAPREEEAKEEDLLSTVDVREQERILREIDRGRRAAGASSGGGSGARGGGGGGGAKGRGGGNKKRDAASAALSPPPDSKQRSIAAMFGRGKSGGGGK